MGPGSHDDAVREVLVIGPLLPMRERAGASVGTKVKGLDSMSAQTS